MALKWREIGTDHHNNELPDGISATARKDDGAIIGYRVRWWEEDEDGIKRQPSKSFSARKFGGSLDRALEAAIAFLAGAREAVKVDGGVAREDTASAMTHCARCNAEVWVEQNRLSLAFSCRILCVPALSARVSPPGVHLSKMTLWRLRLRGLIWRLARSWKSTVGAMRLCRTERAA
jgi:hypothetical protein